MPNDTTVDIVRPIMPLSLIDWYNNGSWSELTNLNPSLSQSSLNQICSTDYECRHDYIIRINRVSSSATGALSNSSQQSRVILGKIFDASSFYF